MQNVQYMQIDGSALAEKAAGTNSLKEFEYGLVSTGTHKEQKIQETEKLSKGEKTTEVTYQNPQQESKAGTVEDVMEQAENIDAGMMKKQMVVASNTTTTTDCRQAQADGFSLQQTDMETVVTVTDKIKMELAKAGIDISYFGDSLSAQQIEAFAGNAVLAQQFAAKVQQMQADIPITADNIEDSRKALQQAEELHKLNDGALKYMLDNQLEPTIANLYLAQYSGSAAYISQEAESSDFSGMEEQIKRIIAQSGRTDEKESFSDSEWLLSHEIPLTAGNLNFLYELKSMDFPPNTEDVLEKMITAVSEGGRPQDAVLSDSHTLSGRAQKAADVVQQTTDEDLAYVVLKGETVTVQNLEKAHNQIQAGQLTAQESSQIADLIQSTAQAENAAQNAVSDTADIISDSISDSNETVQNANAVQNLDKLSENAAAVSAGSVQENANGISENNPEAGAAEQPAGVAATAGTGESSSANMQSFSGSMIQTEYYTEIQITFIVARRHLEEVRLMMTVESSYFMLKQGISVDTGSMEALIDRLKEIENHYYQNLLKEGGVEATQANISLFAETSDKLEQLKEMPAYALGARNMGITTLEDLHQEGSAMQQNFQQANERYETMQTQVRKDLGDSIQKAFQNVDDLLKAAGQEINPANERVVRILGYNHIEITAENITKMKAADQQVQMAFRNLTPSVIREFINQGINPLDLDMKELNRQAEQIKEELDIDAPEEKYSEYLYKLEQNHSITKEERSSYIGIYRLMNHIVQSDGAAVGALVNQGAQITMRNLLAAVRSERHGSVDVSVDDSYGELESGGYKDSITDQIEAGYQQQCVKQAFDEMSPERLRTVTNDAEWEDMTPEQFLQQIQEAPEDIAAEESYYQQKLEDLGKCAKTSEEVYHIMEQYDIPNTVLNVMAVSELMNNRNAAYRRFFQMDNGRRPDAEISADEYMKKDEDGNTEVDFDAIKQELLERFGNEIKKPKELAKAMAELAECAEKCMSAMIIEQDVTSLDIRELKLMNTQISIGAKMASSECFSMPIVVDGEVTNVTLKIVRNKQQKGLVNITLETSRFGKIAAELKARQKGITGYIATNSKETKNLLQSVEDDIAKALQEVQEGPLDMNYIMSNSLNLNYFASKSGSSEEPESEELREVQTKTLYGMAEGFIRILKKLDAA